MFLQHMILDTNSLFPNTDRTKNLKNTTTYSFSRGLEVEDIISFLQVEGLVYQILSVKFSLLRCSNRPNITFELSLEKPRNIKQDTKNLSSFNQSLNGPNSLDRSVRQLDEFLTCLRSVFTLHLLVYSNALKESEPLPPQQKAKEGVQHTFFALYNLCPKV